jgi:hypothetical protein
VSRHNEVARKKNGRKTNSTKRTSEGRGCHRQVDEGNRDNRGDGERGRNIGKVSG